MKTDFESVFARAGWKTEIKTAMDGEYYYVALTAPDGRGLVAGTTWKADVSPARLRDKVFENADADLGGRPRRGDRYWACPGWRDEDGRGAPTPKWAYRSRSVVLPAPGYGSAEELLLKWELYGPGEKAGTA